MASAGGIIGREGREGREGKGGKGSHAKIRFDLFHTLPEFAPQTVDHGKNT